MQSKKRKSQSPQRKPQKLQKWLQMPATKSVWTDFVANISARPGGGTRSENDHTFGPKFAFQIRTLTVQWISMKNHTLTVHFFKVFAIFHENVEIFFQNWPILCQFYQKIGLLSKFPTLTVQFQKQPTRLFPQNICFPFPGDSFLSKNWETDDNF